MLRALGNLLRTHIIVGRIAETLRRYEAAALREQRPIRYVFHIFEDDASELLHQLPFELFCDQSFWFRRANAIGVRLAPYAPEGEPSFSPDSTALVAWASARRHTPDSATLASHAKDIAVALQTAGITPRVLASCTKQSLREEVERGCDLLYIACHSSEDRDSHGRLTLQDTSVTGTEIGEWISNAAVAGRRLQAVLLCACSAAAPGVGTGTSDMAQYLAGGDLAMAALGFRTPVNISWALSFMTLVLDRLATGISLERAVSHARSHLPPETSDWALPLLFARGRDPHAISAHPKIGSATRSTSAEQHTLLPAPNRGYFTGRQRELETLHLWLQKSGAAMLIVGEGGIGKSEVARCLAFQEHGMGHNVIWLERADLDLSASLLALIHLADPTYQAKRGATQEDLRAAMHRTLGAHAGLLVLDGLTSGEAVATLTPSARWNVLVTSRDHTILPGVPRLPIEPLDLDSAQRLLARLVYETDEIPSEDAEPAQRMLTTIGGVPLFIEVTAAQLRHGRSMEEIHADLQSGNGDAPNLAHHILSHTLERLSQEDREAWYSIAALPSVGANAHNLSICLQESEDRAARRLHRLREASLLRFDPDEQRYAMHPLACVTAQRHGESSGTWERALENAARAIFDVACWCNHPIGRATDLALNRWEASRKFLTTIDLSLWSAGSPGADEVARSVGIVEQFLLVIGSQAELRLRAA